MFAGIVFTWLLTVELKTWLDTFLRRNEMVFEVASSSIKYLFFRECFFT